MPPPSGPLDAAAFSPARDPAVLPHLVTGFRRCLGVPRHRKLNPTLSGHGSVTYLTSDTPAAYAVEPEPYRVALRKCCGIAALGDSPLGLEDSCPHCDLSPGATDEALERHIVRCPRAGAWHKVHARIATTMVSIPQEAGAPRDCVLTEVRGLRSADATRPGDVV
eukprot:jgi/Tetstr1/439614/TSEL_028037.t2